MPSQPPKGHEQLSADIERWQLEMAEELGILEELRAGQQPRGQRPVLQSRHCRPHNRRTPPARPK